MICSTCGRGTCVRCDTPDHPDKTCAQVQAADKMKSLHQEHDQASDAYIQRSTKPCPRCKAPIEKNKGCDTMTCTYHPTDRPHVMDVANADALQVSFADTSLVGIFLKEASGKPTSRSSPWTSRDCLKVDYETDRRDTAPCRFRDIIFQECLSLGLFMNA